MRAKPNFCKQFFTGDDFLKEREMNDVLKIHVHRRLNLLRFQKSFDMGVELIEAFGKKVEF